MLSPLPLGQILLNRLANYIMRWSAIKLSKVGILNHTNMAVAYPRIELDEFRAQPLVQESDQLFCFPIANVSTTVIGNTPLVSSNQIAAEGYFFRS